jgi:hypothetical protein
MKPLRTLFAAVAVASWSLIGASAVSAEDKQCAIDPFNGELKCMLVAQPAPPSTVRLSADLPLVWSRLPLNVGELIARGIGCIRDVGGVTEIGAGYVIVLNNIATGEQLYLDYICTWPGETPPEPPPPPPTPAELVEANTNALTVQPALSPPGSIGGLTGLDSWLWCDDPGPVDTGVTLRGWTATGGVQIVQLGWEVDGTGGVADTSTSCGSESAPAAKWTPETKGDYSIALTAVWAGSWDLTWNGIPMGTFPLGPVSLTAPAQPYPVDEYRGELTG